MGTVTYIGLRPVSPIQYNSPKVTQAYLIAENTFAEASINGKLTISKVKEISKMIQDILEMDPEHLKTLNLKIRLNLKTGNNQVVSAIISRYTCLKLSQFDNNQLDVALQETNRILNGGQALPTDVLTYALEMKVEFLSKLKREVEASVALELSELNVEKAYQIIYKKFEDALTSGEITISSVAESFFRMIKDVLRIYPDHLKTLDLLARLNVMMGNAELALKNINRIQRLLSKNMDNPPNKDSLSLYALATRAHALLCLNQYQEALVDANKVLKHRYALSLDETAYVLETKARALSNLNRQEEAIIAWELSKLSSDGVENAYQVVKKKFDQVSESGDETTIENILIMARDILNMNSHHLKTLDLHARLQVMKGEAEEALKSIEKMDIYLSFYALATRARAYLYLQVYREALQETEEILKHQHALSENEIAYVRVTRARAYFGLQEYCEALQETTEILKHQHILSKNEMIYLRATRARTYLFLQKYPEALQETAKILKHQHTLSRDEMTYALATRADAYLCLNQFTQALEDTDWLLEYYHSLPKDEITYVLRTRAQVLSNLKREAEASVVRELSRVTPDAVEKAYQVVRREFDEASKSDMLTIPLINEHIFRMIEDILIIDFKHLKILDLSARLYVKIEDPKTALIVTERMEFHTLYTKATRARAYLCLQKYPEALQESNGILREGLDVGEKAYVLETRAKAFYSLKRITQALGAIQELKKFNPEAAEQILLYEKVL